MVPLRARVRGLSFQPSGHLGRGRPLQRRGLVCIRVLRILAFLSLYLSVVCTKIWFSTWHTPSKADTTDAPIPVFASPRAPRSPGHSPSLQSDRAPASARRWWAAEPHVYSYTLRASPYLSRSCRSSSRTTAFARPRTASLGPFNARRPLSARLRLTMDSH